METFSILASAVLLIVRSAVSAIFAVPVIAAKAPFTVTLSASAGLMYSFAASPAPETATADFTSSIHAAPLSAICTGASLVESSLWFFTSSRASFPTVTAASPLFSVLTEVPFSVTSAVPSSAIGAPLVFALMMLLINVALPSLA